MKLESLKNNKFKDTILKKEQMAILNGGLVDAGTSTPAGQACGTANVYPYRTWAYDYGYDAVRNGVTSYHNRTNHIGISAADCAYLQSL